jgi:hypothetical protein
MSTHEITYEVTEKRSVVLNDYEIRRIALGQVTNADPGLRKACEEWFEEHAHWIDLPIGTIYKSTDDELVIWTKVSDDTVVFVDSNRAMPFNHIEPSLAQPSNQRLELVYRPEVK